MTLSSLELMLLVLVEEGLATPYALKRVGLSIGSTQPALTRMVERSLLARGKRGSRGRIDYRLTGTGRKAKAIGLRTIPKRLMQKQPFEELLRSCALALYAGKKVEVARALGSARSPRNENHAFKHPGEDDLVAQYSWLKACVQQSVLQAQAKALVEIARALRRSGS